MKTLTIDHDSPVAAYQQIADAFRGLVARGQVVPGETLPSVRQLGRQLGVNLNTVAKAYRVLAEEGLIELRQGAAARFIHGSAPPGAVSLDESAARTLHRVFDRWVLDGADRTRVEKLLAVAVDKYFRAARTAKGGSK